MPYTYVHFQFRFVNQEGNTKGMSSHNAKIDEEGIMLQEEPLLFDDIHEIKWHKNRIAFELYPYLTLSPTLTEQIIPRTTSIIIEVEDELEKDVRNLSLQYLTTSQGYQKQHKLTLEGKKDSYRAEQCPNCTAILDLTNYANTHYIYCKHCEIIFDKLKQPIPQSENYRVCPECDFYDRVQDYTEFSCYAVKNDRRFGIKEHEFCDTCAGRLLDKITWKNALFLVALPSTILMRGKATENRSAFYAEIAKANRFAQDGKLKPAEDLYMLMMLRNEKHPALWYNHGLAYLLAGENARAMHLFKRALEYCSNYKPILDMIRLHSAKEIYL
jgi:hypothetical protein